MQLDSILSLVNKNPDDFQHIAFTLISQIEQQKLLDSAHESLRHKFTVKISALLKGKGPQRAFGAYLASVAVKNPHILQSHAKTWFPILLHVLELPDPTAWPAVICALRSLFNECSKNQAILREIGGPSKVGDFAKRLAAILPNAAPQVLKAIQQLCAQFPGPMRMQEPKLTAKLDALVDSQYRREVYRAKSSLVLVDKAPQAIWRQRVVSLLSSLEKIPDGLIYKWMYQWQELAAYFSIRPAKVKVPVSKLVALVGKTLRYNGSDVCLCGLEFILATPDLAVVWAREFDNYIYHMVEASNLGHSVALKCIECTTLLLRTLKRVPAPYLKALKSLYKKATGSSTSKLSKGLKDVLSEDPPAPEVSAFAEAILFSVEGIPQSFRIELEALLLRAGGSELRTAVLYPGRYSVLPMAVNKWGLHGYEALVHPRFPALHQQSTGYTEEIQEEQMPMAAVVVSENVEPPIEVEEEVEEELPQVELEEIPKAHAPTAENEPEERVVPQVSVIEEATSVEIVPNQGTEIQAEESQETREPPEKRQKLDESDDDDEIIIPELTMDSD